MVPQQYHVLDLVLPPLTQQRLYLRILVCNLPKQRVDISIGMVGGVEGRLNRARLFGSQRLRVGDAVSGRSTLRRLALKRPGARPRLRQPDRGYDALDGLHDVALHLLVKALHDGANALVLALAQTPDAQQQLHHAEYICRRDLSCVR